MPSSLPCLVPSSLSTLPILLLLPLLIFPSFLHSTSSLPSPSQPPPPSTPVFHNGSQSMPLAQGWLGADAAYTVPLSPHRTLWLFDDTLSADTVTANRSHCHFVHNTVGIMTCDDTPTLTNCSITYAWE